MMNNSKGKKNIHDTKHKVTGHGSQNQSIQGEGVGTRPSNWAMDVREQGTTTSSTVLDAPGAERSQPSAWLCHKKQRHIAYMMTTLYNVQIDSHSELDIWIDNIHTYIDKQKWGARRKREATRCKPGRRRQRRRGRLGKGRRGWPPPAAE